MNGPSAQEPVTRRPAAHDGLTQAEVQSRLARYGYNDLPKKKLNPQLKFLSSFWGPIPWMIEAAVILSAIVGFWADFGIILTLLVANEVIGFWEESQAGNAIAALTARLALAARVKRVGVWMSIPARELVPGDLIRIRLGDIVPTEAALPERVGLRPDLVLGRGPRDAAHLPLASTRSNRLCCVMAR
jgi:H+-transporting ATPase